MSIHVESESVKYRFYEELDDTLSRIYKNDEVIDNCNSTNSLDQCEQVIKAVLVTCIEDYHFLITGNVQASRKMSRTNPAFVYRFCWLWKGFWLDAKRFFTGGFGKSQLYQEVLSNDSTFLGWNEIQNTDWWSSKRGVCYYCRC